MYISQWPFLAANLVPYGLSDKVGAKRDILWKANVDFFKRGLCRYIGFRPSTRSAHMVGMRPFHACDDGQWSLA